MNILALDCATKTGYATLINGVIESGVHDLTKKRGESNGMLFMKFSAWIRRIPATFDLVVFEQAHHRGGAATEICVGLTTRVMEFAAEIGAEYTNYHTSEIKKRLCGSGRASKDDVMCWFLLKTGRQPIDDNEADARGILELAIEDGVCT